MRRSIGASDATIFHVRDMARPSTSHATPNIAITKAATHNVATLLLVRRLDCSSAIMSSFLPD
jgi:hypothetical protein